MFEKRIKFALVLIAVFMAGAVFAQTGRTIGPLLQTNWTQRTPYNNLMVGKVRHRTGCGTTAMAQIMKYYGYPARGAGQSEPYTTGIGTTVPSVNFNVTYDWNNMLNSYNSSATQRQVDAVATLMYHLAVGFRINSGRTGTDSGTSITRIIQAMTTHFGYDKSMLRRDRIHFDDAAWEKMIRDQLDAGMPVFYWFPGHYYVIDGYDGNGRFHFNWGWGRQNGWYPLTVDWRTLGSEDVEINADDDGQSMIINIKPDAGGVLPGYEIALTRFDVQKTNVVHNEQFEVYTYMRNVNNFAARFGGGQAGAALVDNNGNIAAIMGVNNMGGDASLWSRLEGRPITCFVPDIVAPGQYQLRIITRPTNGEWRFAALSAVRDNVPNAINVTVSQGAGTASGGYGLRMTYFSATKTSASRNEGLNVSVRMRNRGTEPFPGGQAGVALVDNNGNIAAVIGTLNLGALGIGDLMAASQSISCMVPNATPSGQYQLRVVVRPNNGQWRIVTETLVNDGTAPVSRDFNVR